MIGCNICAKTSKCGDGDIEQGVAYSAAKLGVDAVIVAPLGTLQNKVRVIGGDLLLLMI